MTTVREGRRGALVVVDVQVGVMDSAWEADRVVGNIARAVDRAREAGIPVVWVQHQDDELSRLGVSHLALAGAATNWCIRATAYAALERGYDLTLLGDAHTTGSESAAAVVEDLNNVMEWVSYAEVSNTTTAVEELDFSALA